MSKSNWTLDQLKHQLSQLKEVKAWIITEEYVHRRERYFMSEGNRLVTDQDRNVHGKNFILKLIVHLPQEGRQGEITKKLVPSQPLKNQLELAVEAALQTDHQAWELPTEIPSAIPDLVTSDPKMAEDLDRVMNEMTQSIERAVLKKRPSAFNSAELFLSVHNRALHLSNHLVHRSSQSRIYSEAAFSFSKTGQNGKTISDEYLNTNWAVSLNQLSIERLFDETAERAEKSLDVVKPVTGKYPVIIDSEVLSHLLHGHLSLLSASNSYHGLPFIKPGEEFIPQPSGDLLSVTLDPTLEFGASTAALSDQGLLQKPLHLVNKNQVAVTTADKQFADYLNLKPNTVRGNVVVEPGKLTHAELTQQAPRVIEILQFSGLFSDPNSGTFSSEIRLAKLYDNESGKVSYLKGGSLSGSIAENFRGLKLCKNLIQRSYFSTESTYGQGYYGPEYALLSDVSIVG